MSISQHIAGIRSRTNQRTSGDDQSETVQLQNEESINETSSHTDIISQLSVMSLTDSDEHYHGTSTVDNKRSEPKEKPKTQHISISQINSYDDIDLNFNDSLKRMNVLAELELRWADLTKNLDETLNHLRDCNSQVTNSSKACLKSLKNSVDGTCDEVDEEIRAFYHLMTKCDELTTKLSIASSFRDEVKTLRKSIETLEQLYKR